jgi:antitoxin (DNA-binding transcriptional repressor) of toxin-antitoxin stability system
MCHIIDMPSVNMRELRDTKKLKTWLRSGKTVELRERDEAIADIVPRKRVETPAKWPDFEARRKALFGDRILPNVILEDRGRY